jgi:hypothetical protein
VRASGHDSFTMMHNYFFDSYTLMHNCVENMHAYVCTCGAEIHAPEAKLRGFESLNFLTFLMNDEY